jgi:hypothetical protein
MGSKMNPFGAHNVRGKGVDRLRRYRVIIIAVLAVVGWLIVLGIAWLITSRL